MMPYCVGKNLPRSIIVCICDCNSWLDSGIGVIPWSPLARGKLGKQYGSCYHLIINVNSILGASSLRDKTDIFKSFKTPTKEDTEVGFHISTPRATNQHYLQIIKRVWEIAKKYKVSGAQVSLAWLLTKSAVSSPIVGMCMNG